jgi:major membrane immunogen (membrane-anchored lipoprotein)
LSLAAKIISTLFLLVFGLGLTACGSTAQAEDGPKDVSGYYAPFETTLKDGRKVQCVGYYYHWSGTTSTPDCDFANAK